jgi:uncharacterized protein (TIGR03067 family)
MNTRVLAIFAAAILLLARRPAMAQEERDDVVRKELARLQGTWRLVAADVEGTKTPPEKIEKMKVVIEGNHYTLHFGGHILAKDIEFQIDAAKSPKALDDLLADGKVIRGIYQLDGDTLYSCVAEVGKERPTEFVARPSSGHTVRVFRRVKASPE